MNKKELTDPTPRKLEKQETPRSGIGPHIDPALKGMACGAFFSMNIGMFRIANEVQNIAARLDVETDLTVPLTLTGLTGLVVSYAIVSNARKTEKKKTFAAVFAITAIPLSAAMLTGPIFSEKERASIPIISIKPSATPSAKIQAEKIQAIATAHGMTMTGMA